MELPPGSTTEISPKVASQKQQDAVSNNPYNFPIQNVVFGLYIQSQTKGQQQIKHGMHSEMGPHYRSKLFPEVLVHQNI